MQQTLSELLNNPIIQDCLENGAEKYYNIYFRKKSNGKRRKITAPCPELKLVQSAINDILNEELKNWFNDRPYITGFVVGKSIADNARIHSEKEWVANIDLKDFFPSVKRNKISEVLNNICEENSIFNYIGEQGFLNLVTYQGELPQGSPCSPTLANLCAEEVDELIIKSFGDAKWEYSRYADDITLSTKLVTERFLVKAIVDTIATLIDTTTKFKVNHKKIDIKHRSQRQSVTGVVANNKDLGISSKTRNKIRAILHKYKLENKPIDDKIGGILSYIKQININQFNKLTKDFPCELLILHSTLPAMQIKEQLKHMDS